MLHMIDTVEQGHDKALTNNLRPGERQRPVELRRLRRHPEHLNALLEASRTWHLDLEIAQNDTLDAQLSGIRGQRLRPQQQSDVST